MALIRLQSFDSSARLSLYRPTQSQAPATPKPSTPAVKPVYLIVFGYPPDKYSATVEYFRSLGDSTEPDPNLNISNCFRIGYNNPAEAMRAVRKNGEVLSGSWMIGVKWAVRASLGARCRRNLICRNRTRLRLKCSLASPSIAARSLPERPQILQPLT